jgi:hypothetical protein
MSWTVWRHRCRMRAQNNPRVAGIGDDHEVPLFEMDNAVQPLWTASKRRLRRSLPNTRHMWPRSTASRGRTGSRQASSRRRWAMPTRAPPASGVCSGFLSKKHGFIFSVALWKWLTSQIHGKNITENKCHTYKKEFKLKHYSNKKKLHARLFFKYYSLHPKI